MRLLRISIIENDGGGGIQIRLFFEEDPFLVNMRKSKRINSLGKAQIIEGLPFTGSLAV